MLTIGLSDERANVAKKHTYTEDICKGNVKNTFDYISDKFFMSLPMTSSQALAAKCSVVQL